MAGSVVQHLECSHDLPLARAGRHVTQPSPQAQQTEKNQLNQKGKEDKDLGRVLGKFQNIQKPFTGPMGENPPFSTQGLILQLYLRDGIIMLTCHLSDDAPEQSGYWALPKGRADAHRSPHLTAVVWSIGLEAISSDFQSIQNSWRPTEASWLFQNTTVCNCLCSYKMNIYILYILDVSTHISVSSVSRTVQT